MTGLPSLLAEAPAPDGEPDHEVPPAPDAAAAQPDYLPAKFWDAEAGQARVEELARSYLELERRLGGAEGDTVPPDGEGYRIAPVMDGLEPDAEVNARLMEAGFTQAQAQLVYDLAAEKLAPLVQDLAGETLRREHLRRLADHFGGEDRWKTVSHQLQTWGKANLPAPVLEAMAGSYDGVLALHRMMGEGEPDLLRGGAAISRGRSEDDLRRMMDDPRYWREHDKAFVADVQRGFEALYPDEG